MLPDWWERRSGADVSAALLRSVARVTRRWPDGADAACRRRPARRRARPARRRSRLVGRRSARRPRRSPRTCGRELANTGSAHADLTARLTRLEKVPQRPGGRAGHRPDPHAGRERPGRSGHAGRPGNSPTSRRPLAEISGQSAEHGPGRRPSVLDIRPPGDTGGGDTGAGPDATGMADLVEAMAELRHVVRGHAVDPGARRARRRPGAPSPRSG